VFKVQTLNCLGLKISTPNYIVHKRDVTSQHIGLHSHRVDWREFWHTSKSSHFHCYIYSSHFHSHFCIFVFLFPWDSHGNGNPIPMHISTHYATLVRHCVCHIVDGAWSAWSRADICSAAPCSGLRGHKTHFRSCTSPRPMFGGTPCRGRSWKVEPCYNNEFCLNRGITLHWHVP